MLVSTTTSITTTNPVFSLLLLLLLLLPLLQGPLPSTTADFWSMVCELSVPAIVMLGNVTECGVVKCSQYFPQALGSITTAGPFEIKVS